MRMRPLLSIWHPCRVLSVLLTCLLLPVAARAAEREWTELSSGPRALDAWRGTRGWQLASSVEMDPQKPRYLRFQPGEGILVNGLKGRAPDLLSKEKFTDVEVHAEFLIPKHSNSGVKLMGLYEIQIEDSHDVKKLHGYHCGGIYPRAEEEPQYHHLDDGVPPRVNACRPAGAWQTLDITFRAPRFDDHGKKTANARFVKVVLNGKLIHLNVEVRTPTGSAWRLKKEVPAGPLLLQGDHGPVAFRHVRVRPWGGESTRENGKR